MVCPRRQKKEYSSRSRPNFVPLVVSDAVDRLEQVFAQRQRATLGYIKGSGRTFRSLKFPRVLALEKCEVVPAEAV